jgi:hypothetical protein
MNDQRVACPRCGQDWLREIRLVHLERDAIFCPECEGLWLSADDLAAQVFCDYGTYMMAHGRSDPDQRGEIDVRGYFERGKVSPDQ